LLLRGVERLDQRGWVGSGLDCCAKPREARLGVGQPPLDRVSIDLEVFAARGSVVAVLGREQRGNGLVDGVAGSAAAARERLVARRTGAAQAGAPAAPAAVVAACGGRAVGGNPG
jgi:hypothetical protein